MLRRLYAALLVTLAFALSSCAAAPMRGKPSFTFVQMADTQLGMGGYEHDVEMLKRSVAKINELNPDFVVICGDLVEAAKDDKAYSDLLSICSGLAMPVHFVAGNHDTGNIPKDDALAFFRNKVGPDYYRFDNKGYTFLVVDTQFWNGEETAERAAHDSWLRAELQSASADGRPVFVAGHYPFYIGDPLEGPQYFCVPPEPRTEWLNAFYQYGVQAYLSGHAHKEIVHDFMNMQLVTAATTSLNFDQKGAGFNLWQVDGNRPYQVEWIEVGENGKGK